MAAGFKPVLGRLALGTAGFSLTGDNAGFCGAILNKQLSGQPARLASLTYLLPAPGQEGDGQEERSPVVVNLLMQLRASCDQNNVFLRTGQMSQAQILAQLRQTLARSDRAVRVQAAEIERAVRHSLFQENQFRQALARLEREVKKNGGRPEQAVPLSRSGGARMAVHRRPETAVRALNNVPPFMGGRDTKASTGQAERTAVPPVKRAASQARTQMGQAGQTAVPAGQRLAGLRQRGAFPVSGQQAADRRNVKPVRGAALPEGTVPEQGAAPFAGTGSERGAAPLTELRPQKTETPGGTSVRREEALAAPAKARSQAETPQKRPARGAEAPRKEERTAGNKTDEAAKPSTGKETGGGAEPVTVPQTSRYRSTGAVQLERQLSGSYGAWIRSTVEKGSNGGGVWEYSVPSAPHPMGTGGRGSLLPMVQTGWFLTGLRFSAGGTTGNVFQPFHPWNAGTAGQAAGGRATANGFVLQWRRDVSGLELEDVPKAGTTQDKAFPGSGRVSRTAVAPSGAAGHTRTADIRTIAARSMNQGGTDTVFPARTDVSRFFLRTQLGRESVSAVRRGMETGQPDTFPVLRAGRFLRTVGVPKQQDPEQPAPAHAGNGMPAGLGRFMPIFTGAVEPILLKWLNPALPAGTAASSVKVSAPGLRAAGRAIYRTRQVRQALAGSPREGAAVRTEHIGQIQWAAKGRMPRQGLAVLGPAGAERYERIHALTALRPLPGRAGDVFLQWLNLPHTAGTAPAGQGGRVLGGRTTGFAEGGGLAEGRTPGGTAPAKIFRTLDGHTSLEGGAGPENRGGFSAVFRSAAGFGRRGAFPQGQLAAAAAWGSGPVQYPASVRFVPRVLHGVHTQTEGRLLFQQNARPGVGTGASRPENNLLRMGMEMLWRRTYLSRTEAGTAWTGSGPRPMGIGAVPQWNIPRIVGTGAVRPGNIPRSVGVGGVRPGNILNSVRMGAVRLEDIPHSAGTDMVGPGNLLRQAGVSVIRAGSGWLQAESAAQAGDTPAEAEGHSTLSELTHFAQPMEPLEKTLPEAPSGGIGESAARQGCSSPAMIFRSPAPPEARTVPAPEQEGESVLAAQTAAPEQVRAMNRMFSYSALVSAERAETGPDALGEQHGSAAAQAVNYNRLTEEILVRIERRLRAERRKFGL